MTSMERVGAALSHQESDRVPLLLLFGHAAAREAEVEIREYMAREELQVEIQKAIRARSAMDCLSAFTYVGAEVEAMGSEIVSSRDPSLWPAGLPLPRGHPRLEPCRMRRCWRTLRVLGALRGFRTKPPSSGW